MSRGAGTQADMQVRESSAITQDNIVKSHSKRIVNSEKRVAELNTLIKRIYEDFVSGRLTEKRFELFSHEYEVEQIELERSITQLKAEIEIFNTDSNRADRFIEIAHRYTDFSELTPSMINEFIEKIVVHEAEKIDGERCQQVDVYLNFVGQIDLPVVELSPEEVAEEEKNKHRRKLIRERQRRYRARKKAKMEQERLAAEHGQIESSSALTSTKSKPAPPKKKTTVVAESKSLTPKSA